MYHIQYTTQIWEQIAFKIPSKTFFFVIDWLLLPAVDCLVGSWGGGTKGGAIVLANINQSHINVFNRVLNGISSRSGNNITHSHARTHTHTHTSSTAEKRRRALIQQGREVSQPPWKPERQSEGVGGGVRQILCTHTGSSRDETFILKKRRYLTQQIKRDRIF